MKNPLNFLFKKKEQSQVQAPNYWNNAMKSVKIYQQGTTWGFDDNMLGLKFEPFVCGASEAITDWLNNFSSCPNKVNPTMIGSNKEFPGYEVQVFLSSEGGIGDGYYFYYDKKGKIQDLWLCPVLSMFWNPVPNIIYIKFEK